MAHPSRLVLLLVGLLLLLSIDHGLPHRYVPDDTVVRCALGMAQDVSTQGLVGLVPPATRYTTYPYLLPYLDLVALGGRYALGRLTGSWDGAAAFAEAVFEDPGIAWLPGRLVSVLLSLLVPWGVARAARELGRGRGEAALAALLAGSSLLLVQYAHTTRPWAPALGLGSLALALSLRMLRKPTLRAAAAAFGAGAAAGAAFQVGLIFLALPMAACLLPARRPGASRLARAAVGGALAAAILLGLGYPWLLVHGAAGEVYQTSESVLLDGSGGEPAVLQLGGQALGLSLLHGRRLEAVLVAWLAYDPVLVVAGLLGMLGWLRRPRAQGAVLLVVLPGFLLATAFVLYDGTHVRYLLSAHPFLALSAARLLAALVRSGRTSARVVALLALALPVVQAGRLDQILGREDTRTLAARELARRVRPGERLAVDGFGSRYGPPLRPTAASLASYQADAARRSRTPEQTARIWLNRSEQRVLERAAAGLSEPTEARDVVPVSRYWRYDSYYPTDFLFDDEEHDLASWIDEWGIDVFVQVERLPDAVRRAPLTELLAERGELLWEISPTGATDPPRAELPTDMERALFDLWRYERPGPWIRAWRLHSERDG